MNVSPYFYSLPVFDFILAKKSHTHTHAYNRKYNTTFTGCFGRMYGMLLPLLFTDKATPFQEPVLFEVIFLKVELLLFAISLVGQLHF